MASGLGVFMKQFSFLVSLMLLSQLFASCFTKPDIEPSAAPQLMRDLIIKIDESTPDDFIIIPQNGQELLTTDLSATGAVEEKWLAAIDGVGREDLFYGYSGDNKETPEDATNYMLLYLDQFVAAGKTVLVTDYCSDNDKMLLAQSRSSTRNFIPFIAESRMLDIIPSWPEDSENLNLNPINTLADCKSFLYLINPDVNFSRKDDFIQSIDKLNHDLFIIDLFWGEERLSSEDIKTLQTKPNGTRRLVIAYFSIGEAEDYRYYWDKSWKTGDPIWLYKENPDWEGNFKVFYWHSDWQDIIIDSENSYLKLIQLSGFDGVYLDIVDAYEYFM